MSSTAAPYTNLFTAFRDATAAYALLAEKAEGVSDVALARDPAYMRLHRSGMVIAGLGGGEAIRAAIDVLATCAEDEDKVLSDMRRFWAGMEAW